MEHRIRYALLGFFVFFLFGAGVLFLLWQNNYSHNETYDYYIVRTQESVSGLNEKAPVKFRGVNVGEVARLFITPEDSQSVSIVIKIKENTPIKEDTYALIEPQGITGLSYLQLEGGSKESKLLKAAKSDGKDLSIIPTKPSLFSRVDSSFESIAKKTEMLLDTTNSVIQKIDKVISEKNVKHLEAVLENSEKISQNFAQSLDYFKEQQEIFEQLINQALELEKSVIQAAQSVKAVSESGNSTMLKVAQSADSVKDLAQKVNAKLDEGAFDLSKAAQDVTIPLEGAFKEMELLMRQLRQVIREFEQSPSDLLYKSAPTKPAPGENP
jgi:phospholipid/cholesterol/gamma-HCH transport system substrate-binding protein